jgi:hypothetical protein
MDKLPFDPYDFFGYIASGLLIIVGMEMVFGFPQIMNRDLTAIQIAVLILAVYVAGQAVATPAKFILEDFVVGKILKKPSTNLLRSKPPLIGRLIFPGFFHPLPTSVQEVLLTSVTSDKKQPSGEDLFIFVRYDSKILNNENLMKKLDAFRDKYGFNRNLAFAAFIIGLSLFIKSQMLGDFVALKYGIASIIIAVLLFYRYLKFFRQYSFEMFNTYARNK